MDNYLLSGHILRCKLIPNDQVSPDLWVGANRKWRQVPRDRVARVSHNKVRYFLCVCEGMGLRNDFQPRTEEEQSRAEDRLLRRQEEKKRKLEELGIDYDFGDAAYVSILQCLAIVKLLT
jgi:nucleolar protein 15